MSEVKSALTGGTRTAKSGCPGTTFRFITRHGIGNRTHGTGSRLASRLRLQKYGYNGFGPPKRSRAWCALQGGKHSRSKPSFSPLENERRWARREHPTLCGPRLHERFSTHRGHHTERSANLVSSQTRTPDDIACKRRFHALQAHAWPVIPPRSGFSDWTIVGTFLT